MRLTKYAHACVAVEANGSVLLIDPGTFVPNVAELLLTASAVLVTHDHFDHVDADALRTALAARSDLVVHGPASVLAALAAGGTANASQLTQVADGDELDIDGIEVRVVGGAHAQIHDGIPVPHNTGYVIGGGAVYHPGDAYRVPPIPVDTLLVPVSGPWVKFGEAIDFINAVGPSRTVQVHDVMLSDVGRRSAAMFLGADGLTGTPMVELAPGESTGL